MQFWRLVMTGVVREFNLASGGSGSVRIGYDGLDANERFVVPV